MNRLRPLWVFGLTTFAAVSGAAAPWTLRAALDEARAHSPETAIAAARVERAEAQLDQAGAPRLPQLTLRAGYSQTNNPMMAFGAILNQGAFTPAIDFNAPGQIDNLNLTGTVGYALYRGGRTTAGIAAAHAGIAASTHSEAATFARLDVAVTRAYLGIRQSRESLTALDAAVASFEASLGVARLRFEAGQLLKSELLNLEVQLAQTREQHLAVRQQATLASRQFLFLLGRRPAGEVDLAPNDTTLADLTVPAAPSIAQRPELLAMEAQIEAASRLTDLAKGARRPTVNAFASLQHDEGWRLNGTGDGDSWMAGIQAEWAIFDGKATSGKIREARAQLSEVEAQHQQLTLALELELEQAQLGHAFAIEQLAVTASLVAQADEAARISRARFEAGALLSAELIGAETRLTEARVRRSMAAASERIATAEVRRAAGLPLLD